MAYSRIQCLYCSDNFGQELRFLQHLLSQHQIADPEALYIELHLHGVKPLCACGCGEPTTWYGWKKGYTSKYVRGHNAAVDTCFADPVKAKEFAEKRKQGYRSGKYKVWNDGLTKESSEKVAKMSERISESLSALYENGRTPWQYGLTKETDPRVAKAASTRSKALSDGTIQVWNKNKTKHTDERLAVIAKKISDAKQAFDPRRLTVEEFKARIDNFSDKLILLDDPASYRNKYQKLRYKCVTCDQVQVKNLMMLEYSPVCYNCHPKQSKAELELYEFVKSLAPDAVSGDRSVLNGKELDVWVPSKKFGIEFNGLYFHSEKFLPDDYHVQKRELAQSAGITLFNVFEDEWNCKRSIVESMIRSRLGLVTSKVMARKCDLLVLNSKQRREFFDSSHIDGDCRSTVAWGLFMNDQIVAALSLRHPFHKRYANFYEICRFAIRPNTSVSGGLGRLVKIASKFAEQHDKKGLLSYVDLGHGDGHSYESVGFNLISETKPRFWWVDDNVRLNRFEVKANSSIGLTQEQAAIDRGVYKIWGHGNNVYVLANTYPNETITKAAT